VLSILKQTATACTNEFQMFDELALAFPGVPEYFPRTSDIDALLSNNSSLIDSVITNSCISKSVSAFFETFLSDPHDRLNSSSLGSITSLSDCSYEVELWK